MRLRHGLFPAFLAGLFACARPMAAPPSSEPHSGGPPPVVARTPPDPAALREVAASANAFGFDLYRRLRSQPGNLTISPASLSTALTMTWAGAGGVTEREMRRVLHLHGEAGGVVRAAGALMSEIADPRRLVKLRVANRLFLEQTNELAPAYREAMAQAFDAPIEPADFIRNAEPARMHINAWVAERTEQKIRDLLPAGILAPDTRLVIVNALYFLADWARPFDTVHTRDARFDVNPREHITVPTMHRLGTFRIAERRGVKVLELPYRGETTSMLVILPNATDGLANVEKNLDVSMLYAWMKGLEKRYVDVSLPRFEMDPAASLQLEEALSAMGMPSAFNERAADFTGMRTEDDLYIGHVLHKTFVKVDEKGTEAAAATAVVMALRGGMSAAPPPVEFKADHPFAFAIRDDLTGLILFLGRVRDPRNR